MKKFLFSGFPLALMMALGITGCGQPNNPAGGQTAAPAAGNDTAVKINEIQSIVNFVMTSAVNGIWKVYGKADGHEAPEGVIVSYNPGTGILVLIHKDDVPAGDYWVTVTETGKIESARLKLTVLNPRLKDLTFASDAVLQEGDENAKPGSTAGIFSGTGGERPYIYSLVSGNNDNSLFSLDSNTGVLTVKDTALTAGEKTIQAGVTDNIGDKIEKSFIIIVYAEGGIPGSADNPFKVNDEAGLRAVGRGGTEGFVTSPYASWTLDKFYEQTADITLTGGNWQRIEFAFTGSYDGKGNTITGLVITGSGGDLGMFSTIGAAGTVKNLGLESGGASGTGYIGHLAARNAGTVENCFSTGNVTAAGNAVGGLLGNNSGVVRNSFTTGNVTSTGNNGSHAGGVVGFNTGTVENCFATGVVTGDHRNVGGVVGDNRVPGQQPASGGRVVNCIALNRRVSLNADIISVGRVAGGNEFNQLPGNANYNPDNEFGFITNSFAWSGIELRKNHAPLTLAANETGPEHKNGGDINTAEMKTKETWEAAGFLFTDSTPAAGPWTWDHGGVNMPGLHGEKTPWGL